MTDTARQWTRDGIMKNSRDAQQIVQANRAEFSKSRAKGIIENALKHGHDSECNEVFHDALKNLEW